MHTQQELRTQLRQIDHKGYKAYKVLEGEYDFGAYRLCIDHVQGDPFATPSRLRIVYQNRGNIPRKYMDIRTGGTFRASIWRQSAAELRQRIICCADCMRD